MNAGKVGSGGSSVQEELESVATYKLATEAGWELRGKSNCRKAMYAIGRGVVAHNS